MFRHISRTRVRASTATEIKVRAERRCGELLRTTEKNTGARMNGAVVERCDRREAPTLAGNVNPATRKVSNDATPSTPTLADMGLTRDESSRYQSIAVQDGFPIRSQNRDVSSVDGWISRLQADSSRRTVGGEVEQRHV